MNYAITPRRLGRGAAVLFALLVASPDDAKPESGDHVAEAESVDHVAEAETIFPQLKWEGWTYTGITANGPVFVQPFPVPLGPNPASRVRLVQGSTLVYQMFLIWDCSGRKVNPTKTAKYLAPGFWVSEIKESGGWTPIAAGAPLSSAFDHACAK